MDRNAPLVERDDLGVYVRLVRLSEDSGILDN